MTLRDRQKLEFVNLKYVTYTQTNLDGLNIVTRLGTLKDRKSFDNNLASTNCLSYRNFVQNKLLPKWRRCFVKKNDASSLSQKAGDVYILTTCGANTFKGITNRRMK